MRLALAYHVDRLIESGELRSHSVAASTLGVTKGRLARIMALLNLAPGIQERILTGRLLARSVAGSHFATSS
jgi:hypothetical protein